VNKNIVKYLAAVIFSASIISCISIDTEITFKQDLTGEVLIKYSVSKSALNIGKLDQNDSFMPLPLEEQKYRDKAGKVNGLDFKSFKKEETAEEIYITVRYEFRNNEALNAIISNNQQPLISVERRSGSVYFTQNIYNSSSKPAGEETIKLAQALYADRLIKMKVTAPSQIKTVNSGTSAGNTAEVQYRLPELLSKNTPVIWEISW
jgi:hypothetical protein